MSAAERVRKLAALAGSDNEHEANEAARQACRLIREGKVAIVEPVQEEPPWFGPRGRAWRQDPWRAPPPPPRPKPPPPPKGPFARRRDVSGATCVVCREEIEPGDAFACADGYVHGDCVPASERA